MEFVGYLLDVLPRKTEQVLGFENHIAVNQF